MASVTARFDVVATVVEVVGVVVEGADTGVVVEVAGIGVVDVCAE